MSRILPQPPPLAHAAVDQHPAQVRAGVAAGGHPLPPHVQGDEAVLQQVLRAVPVAGQQFRQAQVPRPVGPDEGDVLLLGR
jgi:hypothetical protein